MTHEYFTINYVMTDSFRTTKVINILNTKFQFFKWSKNRFDFGIVKKNGLMHSDKEKTVLDLIYKRYRKDKSTSYTNDILREYCFILDKSKIMKYLQNYPNGFQEKIRVQL